MTDRQACCEAVKAFAGERAGVAGEIHCLVNCAVFFGSKALEACQEDWTKSFSVNVVGYANMVQECHALMKGKGGAVVNVASVSGHRAQPNRCGTCAALCVCACTSAACDLCLLNHVVQRSHAFSTSQV